MAVDTKLTFERTHRPLILSQFTRWFVSGLLVVVLAGYLAWQGWQLLGPPTIHITQPSDGLHTHQAATTFAGSTGSSVSVSVNGNQIPLQPNGTFEVQVPLQPGPNRLLIHLANRAGRTRDLTRIVSYDFDFSRGN